MSQLVRTSGFDLTTSYHAPRFDPQLLSDTETLLVDVLVDCTFTSESDTSSTCSPTESQFLEHHQGSTLVRGRLRIGTINVFFDEDDWRSPIVRVCYRDIIEIQWKDDNGSPWMCLRVAGLTFMKERGIDHAYIESVCSKGLFTFCGVYTSLRDAFCLVSRLKDLVKNKAFPQIASLVEERGIVQMKEIQNLELSFRSCPFVRGVRVLRIGRLAETPGVARITEGRFFFSPLYAGETGDLVVDLGDVKDIHRMRYAAEERGLEVWGEEYSEEQANGGRAVSLFLVFETVSARDDFWRVLLDSVTASDSDEDRLVSGRGKAAFGVLDSVSRISAGLVSAWRAGLLSNYGYLMQLNIAGGRSFDDLSQYPVFPWVVADYESDELNLEDKATFRDLGKPIGAINEERLKCLQERYAEMPPPRFLYGTHYSAPGYVISYLMRSNPGAMLKLHSGKFDTADRLFYSIPETWRQVTGLSTTDVKELIPEFYTITAKECRYLQESGFRPGKFLRNTYRLDLGVRSDGQRVDDVVLPPWARGSAEKFVKEMRRALESDYVSRHLPKWIDLVFGYRISSAAANNVYYTDVVCESSLSVKDKQTVLRQFGSSPRKVFHSPHPSRTLRSCPILSRLGKSEPEVLFEAKSTDGENKIQIISIGFQKVGEHLLIVVTDGKLCWKRRASQNHFQISLTKRITSSCVASKSNRAFLGTADGFVLVFDAEESHRNALRSCRRVHDDAIVYISYSSAGLVTAGSDGYVKLWDVHEGVSGMRQGFLLVVEVDTESPVTACSLLEVSDNLTIVASLEDGRIAAWLLQSGTYCKEQEPLFTVQCDYPACSVAIQPQRGDSSNEHPGGCIGSVLAIIDGKLFIWHCGLSINIVPIKSSESWNDHLHVVVAAGESILLGRDKGIIEVDNTGAFVEQLDVEEDVTAIGYERNGVWAKLGMWKIVMWKYHAQE